nr:uncharacterized protein LOC127329196 [Lolium perenne]
MTNLHPARRSLFLGSNGAQAASRRLHGFPSSPPRRCLSPTVGAAYRLRASCHCWEELRTTTQATGQNPRRCLPLPHPSMSSPAALPPTSLPLLPHGAPSQPPLRVRLKRAGAGPPVERGSSAREQGHRWGAARARRKQPTLLHVIFVKACRSKKKEKEECRGSFVKNKNKAKVNFSESYLIRLNSQVIELYELLIFLKTVCVGLRKKRRKKNLGGVF